MASELFDPLLDLALSVAKRGKKAKPPIAPPPRLVPMLKFAKLPDKAKDAVLDVLDTDDDFRERVANKATEKKVGRIGMAYVERNEGWETFVGQMVDAAEEPIIGTRGSAKKLEHQLDVSERALARAEADLDDARNLLAVSESSLESVTEQNETNEQELARLRKENAELTEQRQRAVSELKRTEEVMARHVAERKRLEELVETMTAAQLSTATVGGGVTDHEVRVAVDAIDASIVDLQLHVGSLRRAATPEQISVARRIALPVPNGLLDDSDEYADYLLSIPQMTVLVDGYNVTKLAHDDWDLEQQRSWLEQGLRSVQARCSATFDVVFDGGDVGETVGAGRDGGVRVRFSPVGVEADDVIIDAVAAIDQARPVTVVSSDKRVCAGAAKSGANVLSSAQLVAILR